MYKRKTYIINKEFQYGLIATFLVIVVCSLLLFSAGFIAYYIVTGLVGENAFDEFIEISRQVKMRVLPIKDSDIVKPKELAQKIKSGGDDVSLYIRENLSRKELLETDFLNPALDEFEIQKKLQEELNILLKNIIRRSETFFSEERFKGRALSPQLEAQAKAKLNPQSLAAYNLNLQLLAAAYSEEIRFIPGDKPEDFIDFEFQKFESGIKRYELALPPVIINNLVLMAVIIVVGIFYSHRIAGPIYRLEQDIGRVLSGERGVQVKLRKKDKLKPLAVQVNRLIDELEKLRGK